MVKIFLFVLMLTFLFAVTSNAQWRPYGQLLQFPVIENCSRTGGDIAVVANQTIFYCDAVASITNAQHPGSGHFYFVHEYGHLALQSSDERLVDCWAAKQLSQVPNGDYYLDAAIAHFNARPDIYHPKYDTPKIRAIRIRTCADSEIQSSTKPRIDPNIILNPNKKGNTESGVVSNPEAEDFLDIKQSIEWEPSSIDQTAKYKFVIKNKSLRKIICKASIFINVNSRAKKEIVKEDWNKDEKKISLNGGEEKIIEGKIEWFGNTVYAPSVEYNVIADFVEKNSITKNPNLKAFSNDKEIEEILRSSQKRFSSLLGEFKSENEDFKIWNSKIVLPGMEKCEIWEYKSDKSIDFQCDYPTFSSVAEVEKMAEKWRNRISSGTNSNWQSSSSSTDYPRMTIKRFIARELGGGPSIEIVTTKFASNPIPKLKLGIAAPANPDKSTNNESNEASVKNLEQSIRQSEFGEPVKRLVENAKSFFSTLLDKEKEREKLSDSLIVNYDSKIKMDKWNAGEITIQENFFNNKLDTKQASVYYSRDFATTDETIKEFNIYSTMLKTLFPNWIIQEEINGYIRFKDSTNRDSIILNLSIEKLQNTFRPKLNFGISYGKIYDGK